MVTLYASLSLTVMLQRPKDSALSMNVPRTGTTPMKTTAACIMLTFTPVLLRSWSVVLQSYGKRFSNTGAEVFVIKSRLNMAHFGMISEATK